MSSVSVGKPAIRSAPIVASGRAALIRSTIRTASARLWRRFMRLRIRSSPACSDRWKCGISRGSPAISSSKASSISMLSSDDRRRRLRPRLGGEQPLAQEPKPAFVTGDVDAGEHDLLRAFGKFRRDRVRIASNGSERLGPRACQMVQKVQRWSQPVWMATKLRTRDR